MLKTKIIFLVGSFEVGGKERQLAEIIKHLPQDKYELHLFVKSLKAHYLSDDEIAQHLQSVRVLNKSRFSLSDVWRLALYINKVRPDVVFSFSTTLSHFILAAKPFCKAKFRLINGSIRNAPDSFSLMGKIERVLYNLYSVVVANSKAGLEAYGQSNCKNRYVLYNGFSDERKPSITKELARKQLGFELSCFYVVMVSSLRKDYSKDPLTFLRTAQEVSKITPLIKFILVGDGERKKEVEEFISSNNIKNVELPGSRDDIELIFIASDLSVLTSKTEGISNSILEAMACGVPVLATSRGGTSEIIESGVSGFITPFGDYQVLSEKILFLKSNPEILKEFSVNGVALVKKKFSLEAMINNFEAIIAKVTFG